MEKGEIYWRNSETHGKHTDNTRHDLVLWKWYKPRIPNDLLHSRSLWPSQLLHWRTIYPIPFLQPPSQSILFHSFLQIKKSLSHSDLSSFFSHLFLYFSSHRNYDFLSQPEQCIIFFQSLQLLHISILINISWISPLTNSRWWYAELVLSYVQCTKEHQNPERCQRYYHVVPILAQGASRVLRGFTKDVADLNTNMTPTRSLAERGMLRFVNASNVAERYWYWVSDSRTTIRLLTEL